MCDPNSPRRGPGGLAKRAPAGVIDDGAQRGVDESVMSAASIAATSVLHQSMGTVGRAIGMAWATLSSGTVPGPARWAAMPPRRESNGDEENAVRVWTPSAWCPWRQQRAIVVCQSARPPPQRQLKNVRPAEDLYTKGLNPRRRGSSNELTSDSQGMWPHQNVTAKRSTLIMMNCKVGDQHGQHAAHDRKPPR
jgi:hypothetical protein